MKKKNTHEPHQQTTTTEKQASDLLATCANKCRGFGEHFGVRYTKVKQYILIGRQLVGK